MDVIYVLIPMLLYLLTVSEWDHTDYIKNEVCINTDIQDRIVHTMIDRCCVNEWICMTCRVVKDGEHLVDDCISNVQVHENYLLLIEVHWGNCGLVVSLLEKKIPREEVVAKYLCLIGFIIHYKLAI